MPPEATIAERRDEHRLARSIHRLAIQTVREASQRSDRNREGVMAEREEQFQVKMSGIASDYPAWATAYLPFDTVFTIATGNRRSSLQRPQIMVGFEVLRTARRQGAYAFTAAEGVILTAFVREWHFDDAHAIDGATVTIGAHAPGDELEFDAFAHITFQGFGTASESSDEAG